MARPGTTTTDGGVVDRIAQASLLLDQMDLDGAESICRELVRQHPEDGTVHALAGDVYAARLRWQEAVQAYERALDIDFDPDVMSKLAAARGNLARGSAQPMSASAPIRLDSSSTDAPASPYVVGAVIAGVLVVSLAAFFLVSWLNREEDATRPSILASRSQAYDDDIYGDSSPASGSNASVPQGGQPRLPSPPTGVAAASGATATIGAAGQDRGVSLPTSGRPVTARGGAGTAARTTAQPAPTSEADRKILRQLRLTRQRPGGATVRASAMALDDYSGLGILTVNATPSADLNRFEADLLYAAYRAALQSLTAEASLNTLVVRCVSLMPNSRGQEEDTVVFRASVARKDMERWLEATRTPTHQEIRSQILQEVWWNQEALARYLTQQGKGGKKASR